MPLTNMAAPAIRPRSSVKTRKTRFILGVSGTSFSLIAKTLVKTAKITLDYDGIYGNPDKFIESVYQSL